eukprot:CAMPEP_0206152666 /NCGR_PEP_ID=MMETSP1473-20131121/39446_1 /ASSEMBLY_ACC=CAM_ASM_001109 /TAXON_ID=1461547 /ORGANISM="Stichococcus sp, Strain RCC1054" /LENGTH=248 /DNA_ID=CAMNT_0053550229 /DNA_START=441 /DNA_END=1185 /DNA_ORIENTATION=-
MCLPTATTAAAAALTVIAAAGVEGAAPERAPPAASNLPEAPLRTALLLTVDRGDAFGAASADASAVGDAALSLSARVPFERTPRGSKRAGVSLSCVAVAPGGEGTAGGDDTREATRTLDRGLACGLAVLAHLAGRSLVRAEGGAEGGDPSAARRLPDAPAARSVLRARRALLRAEPLMSAAAAWLPSEVDADGRGSNTGGRACPLTTTFSWLCCSVTRLRCAKLLSGQRIYHGNRICADGCCVKAKSV